MNIITILNVGLRVSYWKTDIHPYFTKNLDVKPQIKNLKIAFYKWEYEKSFYPTYKITVTWEDIRISSYQLESLFEMTRGVHYTIDSQSKKIIVLFKGDDSNLSNFEDIIKNMKIHLPDDLCGCEDEGEELEKSKPLKFKTEVVLV